MNTIKLVGEEQNILPMEKYMRNQFQFLGVKSPELSLQTKDHIKESKRWDLEELRNVVAFYWSQEEREYVYLAIALIRANISRFTFEELLLYRLYFSNKSWWDSVDILSGCFGLWAKSHLDYVPELSKIFREEEDFWQRRAGILFQLTLRENTHLDSLEKSIVRDIKTDEFFIQKAIGWALRQYSKTDAKWVKEFIRTHELSNLAKREGLKWLEKHGNI